MIRIRIATLIAVFIVAPILLLAAQDLDVRIYLYDEHVYFSDSEIQVHVTVENDTPETAHFRLAGDRRYNLGFEVRDHHNESLAESADFIIARSTFQVFYRTVTLEPGERLSFIEPLRDYVDIPTNGTFTVQARFYPMLAGGGTGSDLSNYMISNPISLHVRPGFTAAIRTDQQIESVVDDRLVREDLSPDRVVTHLIQALQTGMWDRFFLYVDEESLYRSVPERDRAFRRMSEQMQLETVIAYREELQRIAEEESDQLVLVPDEFTIIETSYTPTEGTVAVDSFFDEPTYRERRRYEYELLRRNNYWEVVDYRVVSLSREQLRR